MLENLYQIIQKLRAPGGCPWDIKQTPQTLRGALIEETYECIESIDSGDKANIKEELGDLFLLVTMLSYMHEQKGEFSVQDVLGGVEQKLIRRHPHVFDGVTVKDSDEVLENWAKIKVEKEGKAPKNSILDEVSRALPPLDRAFKLQEKAAKSGFDWPSLAGVLCKVEEELDEVKDEIEKRGSQKEPHTELEAELGDLLFAVINLCRYLGVEPSLALQRTNNTFYSRFKYIEKRFKEEGLSMPASSLNDMEKFWNEAKQCLSQKK
ncbi:MAG: nucleoside triphosphate pyrophosphohydrolase [Spirochaetaceae bacterium]|jgi:tetrapyrrole methylase family protein/MazG family protein|nr:nucleoside triphosphate pyrophosphohydrolase [Spirochaetaceae bacterium]GMO29353.1 MAG: hypothetical protein Pg6A_17450 [Termitinemataceae bacterium]